MNDAERRAFERGCDSVLAELWNVIAEFEESRSDTGYGRAQLFILREVVGRMTE